MRQDIGYQRRAEHPRPGVTRTVKDMVNGALVLQAAYGAFYLHLNQAERKNRHEIA